MTLTDRQRAELMEFFGVSKLTRRQLGAFEDTLSTSIALKAKPKAGIVH